MASSLSSFSISMPVPLVQNLE